jgi:hypothetical protein
LLPKAQERERKEFCFQIPLVKGRKRRERSVRICQKWVGLPMGAEKWPATIRRQGQREETPDSEGRWMGLG